MKILNSYKRLQYSPFDLGIILVGVACIIAGSLLLNSSFDSSGNFRNVETFGHIKKGEGSRKLGSSLQWFDIDYKSELFYGDVIFANESKDIEIELAQDKDSKLIVPKNSMIKITKANGEFNLDVSRGSVLINSKKRKKINIRDKRGKVRRITVSKGSKIKISSKKSNVTVEAITGKAQIQTIDKLKKPKTLQVEKGKLLMVGPKKSKVVNKIKIVSQKRIDPTFQSRVKLSEKFRGLKSIEVSKNEEFKDKMMIPVRKGEINISSLSTGEFYIREAPGKDYDSFRVKTSKEIELSISKPKEMYQGDKLKVEWTGRSELMYRIDIKNRENEEKKFSKLVQGNSFLIPVNESGKYDISIKEQKFGQKASSSTLIKLKKGLAGAIFEQMGTQAENKQKITFKNPRKKNFRFKVVNQDGKIAVNKVSKKEEFKFSKLRPGIYSLKITSPDESKLMFKKDFSIFDEVKNNRTKKLIVTDTDYGKINIKWARRGAYPKNVEYTVNIYKEKTGEVVLSKKVKSKNNFVFKTKNFGKYSWEVIPEKNEVLSKSEKTSFSLERPKIGELSKPKIILKYLEDRDCYQFTIPPNKYAKIYDVFIYSSRVKKNGFWRNMYRKRLKLNKDCIKSKGEGKYYYKYRILDKWKRESKFSKLGEIYFPISPLDDF